MSVSESIDGAAVTPADPDATAVGFLTLPGAPRERALFVVAGNLFGAGRSETGGDPIWLKLHEIVNVDEVGVPGPDGPAVEISVNDGSSLLAEFSQAFCDTFIDALLADAANADSSAPSGGAGGYATAVPGASVAPISPVAPVSPVAPGPAAVSPGVAPAANPFAGPGEVAVVPAATPVATGGPVDLTPAPAPAPAPTPTPASASAPAPAVRPAPVVPAPPAAAPPAAFYPAPAPAPPEPAFAPAEPAVGGAAPAAAVPMFAPEAAPHAPAAAAPAIAPAEAVGSMAATSSLPGDAEMPTWLQDPNEIDPASAGVIVQGSSALVIEDVTYLGGHPSMKRKRKKCVATLTHESFELSGGRNASLVLPWSEVTSIEAQNADEARFRINTRIASESTALVVQCTDGSTVLFEAHSCPKVALKGAIAQLVAGLSVIVI